MCNVWTLLQHMDPAPPTFWGPATAKTAKGYTCRSIHTALWGDWYQGQEGMVLVAVLWLLENHNLGKKGTLIRR